MLDNYVLDALAYLGYNLAADKSNGTIFVDPSAGSNYTAAYPYNAVGAKGIETVANRNAPAQLGAEAFETVGR